MAHQTCDDYQKPLYLSCKRYMQFIGLAGSQGLAGLFLFRWFLFVVERVEPTRCSLPGLEPRFHVTGPIREPTRSQRNVARPRPGLSPALERLEANTKNILKLFFA